VLAPHFLPDESSNLRLWLGAHSTATKRIPTVHLNKEYDGDGGGGGAEPSRRRAPSGALGLWRYAAGCRAPRFFFCSKLIVPPLIRTNAKSTSAPRSLGCGCVRFVRQRDQIGADVRAINGATSSSRSDPGVSKGAGKPSRPGEDVAERARVETRRDGTSVIPITRSMYTYVWNGGVRSSTAARAAHPQSLRGRRRFNSQHRQDETCRNKSDFK
jgi:hypothetical protein